MFPVQEEVKVIEVKTDVADENKPPPAVPGNTPKPMLEYSSLYIFSPTNR